MTDKPRKRPVWPMATAALLLFPLLYVLSIGPVNWYYLNFPVNPRIDSILEAAYSPIRWLRESGPDRISDGLTWYLDLWTPHDLSVPAPPVEVFSN